MEETDSTKTFRAKIDSLTKKWINPYKGSTFTRLRMGFDLFGYGQSIWRGEGTSSYEFTIDTDFGRKILQVDFGRETRTLDTAGYFVSGNFFKIGLDKNFSLDNNYKSQIFVGVRYAQSRYQDRITKLTVNDDIWGETSISTVNDRQRAHWYELAIGMRVAIMKNLYMGYTFKYETIFKRDSPTKFEAFHIPGWGLATKTVNMRFNFHLLYQIPIKWGKKKEREGLDLLIDLNSIKDSAIPKKEGTKAKKRR